MNNKETYQCTELEIIRFETGDVITTSPPSSNKESDELPLMKENNG